MQNAMSSVTALVLAAFLAYAAGWYFGFIEGNFALLLLLATVLLYLIYSWLVGASRLRLS